MGPRGWAGLEKLPATEECKDSLVTTVERQFLILLGEGVGVFRLSLFSRMLVQCLAKPFPKGGHPEESVHSGFASCLLGQSHPGGRS